MSEVRLYASHPDFQKFDLIQRMLLIATNPQLFFGFEVDVPEMERLATVEKLKWNIKVMMDEYEPLPANLADYVNTLEEELNEND